VKLLLVDDHPMVLEAIRINLPLKDPSMQVVGEAATAREAISLAEQLRPEMVVMDLLLPGESGLAAMRDIRRRGLDCKMLVYTAVNEVSLAKEAFAAGAQGYVLKTSSVEQFFEAIAQVGRGQTYVPPGFADQVEDLPAPRAAGLEALSPREREIFDLIAAGKSSVEVASSLFISVKTVETHRSRINRKLGVHSTGELIRFAALSGTLCS
jgi:DNA-binding NarL/FixJ family response regulator